MQSYQSPPFIPFAVLYGLITFIGFMFIIFVWPVPQTKSTENIDHIENIERVESGLKLVRTMPSIEALLREGDDEHPDSAAVYEDTETGQRYLIVTTHHGGVSVTLLDSIGPDTQDIEE